MILLNDSIREIKSIGPKIEELYNKLGIYSIRDMIEYYPKDYYIYDEIKSDEKITCGQFMAISGVIYSQPVLKRMTGKDMIICSLKTEIYTIQLMWFNSAYLLSILKKNTRFVVHGKISNSGTRLNMIQPKLFTPEEYAELVGRLLPVYRLTKGITNRLITNHMHLALDIFNKSDEFVEEILPDKIIKKYDFPKRGEAVCNLHFPKENKDFFDARRRYSYEELFYFRYSLNTCNKNNTKALNIFKVNNFDIADAFIESLPFNLTIDQNNAIEDIKKDLSGQYVNQRLLQGDVGSGKTVVAVYACIASVSAGHQAAIMAPTEVLAKQHYDIISEYLDRINKHITVVLLTGSLSQKNKKKVYSSIADGTADIIIGTHALIQEGLTYNDLGFTVIDEQHRFGVNQRADLILKGGTIPALYMTATPIPRTMAMFLYGNIKISEIRIKPSERLPVKSCVISFSKRTTAFNFILKEIQEHHQAFIICPMIEENEMFNCVNISDYQKEVKSYFGNNIRVSVLHGKMSGEQKEKIMQDFSEGKSDILISTTVIEVGIDIKNASVILIENAERFGLSQLHQLRGRVGRSDIQSYCIFVNSSENQQSKDRMNIIMNNNDGFKIAQEDLLLRGPGDLFGTRQSGNMNFKFADIVRDSEILKCAEHDADELFESGLNESDKKRITSGLLQYGTSDSISV